MDTTNPEYAARKWLTDSPAEEAETCIDLLDELERLRAIEKAVRRLAHVAPDEAPEAWHDVLVLLGEDAT